MGALPECLATSCKGSGTYGTLVTAVALSTADSDQWLLLIEGHLERQTPEVITSSNHRLNGPIRQRQRRLTEAQVVDIAANYEAGATVYELAAEFFCHRTTVAERLKKAGIVMRGQSPTSEDIKSMVPLALRVCRGTGATST
jgi:hypothetical protein